MSGSSDAPTPTCTCPLRVIGRKATRVPEPRSDCRIHGLRAGDSTPTTDRCWQCGHPYDEHTTGRGCHQCSCGQPPPVDGLPARLHALADAEPAGIGVDRDWRYEAAKALREAATAITHLRDDVAVDRVIIERLQGELGEARTQLAAAEAERDARIDYQVIRDIHEAMKNLTSAVTRTADTARIQHNTIETLEANHAAMLVATDGEMGALRDRVAALTVAIEAQQPIIEAAHTWRATASGPYDTRMGTLHTLKDLWAVLGTATGETPTTVHITIPEAGGSSTGPETTDG